MVEIKVGQRYKVEDSPVSGIPKGGMVQVAAVEEDRVVVFIVAKIPTVDIDAGGIVPRQQEQHFGIPRKEFTEKRYVKTTAKMRDVEGDPLDGE